jgi:hypothetical protein
MPETCSTKSLPSSGVTSVMLSTFHFIGLGGCFRPPKLSLSIPLRSVSQEVETFTFRRSNH